MHRNAILRWPHGYTWGHLSVCMDDGKPKFVGFVRLTDERVQDLIDNAIVTETDGDMWEAHFAVPVPETLSVLASAGP